MDERCYSLRLKNRTGAVLQDCWMSLEEDQRRREDQRRQKDAPELLIYYVPKIPNAGYRYLNYLNQFYSKKI